MVDLLKTFLSREMENKIDEYLLKMKSKNFLPELNLDLNSKYISLKSYNLHDLEQLKSIWLEIANLSVNLYVEYEFFRQFSFPNRYESKIYEENLKKLGYKQYNGMWKIDKIPNKQCIIENIFYSYIYIFLWQEKKQELDNEQFMKENENNSLLCRNLINEIGNNDAPSVIRAMRKSNEAICFCPNCNKQLFNGICQICVSESKSLKTNFHNINKGDEDRSVKMRSNSLEVPCISKIETNLLSQWTCKFCTYIHTNSSSNFCEMCLLSKFAKRNSCVFESSFEALNEKEIDSEKHDQNKDKWTCTECTFNNKMTVDSCVICLMPNLNKIVTMDDYELPEETWCCKTCRENNLFECYKCKKCRVLAEFFNKWRCGQCSFYNDKVAICCGACETGNPYLVKCNLCDESLVNKMYDKICKECIVLSERCTNKETVGYQDNRGTQSETSVERNQRRDEINENQNNLKNDVSQNRDSSVNEKKNCEQTGSLANNNKTQSETSEFDNLLPGINQNNEKLEDIQENIENKDKIPTVIKTKNKMNSKPCKNCKSKVCANNQYWCTKCEDSQWYCRNENCNGINFQNEYCKKCKAKKGSDFSNCYKFWVMKDKIEVQMWQCAFCLQFIYGQVRKCGKCKGLHPV